MKAPDFLETSISHMLRGASVLCWSNSTTLAQGIRLIRFPLPLETPAYAVHSWAVYIQNPEKSTNPEGKYDGRFRQLLSKNLAEV